MIFSKKKSHLSDCDLVLNYKKSGRKKWVGELFNRYAHLVFGVCMKYLQNEVEAKDMTLNVFENVLRNLPKYEMTKFSSWIYVATKNACLTRLRKQGAIKISETALNTTEYAKEDDDKVLRAQRISRMEEAIEELNDQQKQCIQLFYIKKKCYNEVASLTGYSIKQVKSFIQKGKRKLKLKLQQHNEFKS